MQTLDVEPLCAQLVHTTVESICLGQGRIKCRVQSRDYFGSFHISSAMTAGGARHYASMQLSEFLSSPPCMQTLHVSDIFPALCLL